MQTIDEHNVAWRKWFITFGVQPYPVMYENLARDPAGATRGMLDFLGLDLAADREIAPGTRRQADRLNALWIATFGLMIATFISATGGLPSEPPAQLPAGVMALVG